MPTFDHLLTISPVTGAERRVSVELLRDAYLAPRAMSFDLGPMVADPAMPWAASYEVARPETARAVEHALRAVMLATTTLNPDEIDLSALAPDSRLARHMQALVALWRALGGALPEDLAIIRHVLNCGPEDALEPLPLVDAEPSRRLTALEIRLREVLLDHHSLVPGTQAKAWQDRQAALAPTGPDASSLRQAIAGLTGQSITAAPLDASLEFFALRDHAEEAEFAAALAQQMVDTGMAPRDIGLLVPDDPMTCQHLDRAFGRVGIALSGLPGVGVRRDIAGETLLNYLIAIDRPAPAMALASLYTSPLMPWPAETGRELAREVMRGRYTPYVAEQLNGRPQSFFQGLAKDAPTNNVQLVARLDQLMQSMNDAPELRDDVLALRRAVTALKASLKDNVSFNLAEIRKEVTVGQPAAAPVVRTTEGVTVIAEGSAPWRPVRQLIVLGMAAGRYPRPSSVSPLFLDSELGVLAEQTGLKLPTRADQLKEALRLLSQQLSSASERCIFLHPLRTAQGKRQLPSAGLSLLARTILAPATGKSVDDIMTLMADPWIANGGKPVVAVADIPAVATAPVAPAEGSLQLDRDLFALRLSKKGTPATQSPSRLEHLLVSPLAWALAELGAEPLVWGPEQFDPATAGTLAHEVFEHLFPKHEPLPDEPLIEERAPQLLASAIRNRAPFLAASAWKVERQGLERDVIRAAKRWRAALEAAGASVVANEFDLTGSAFSLNLFGRVDCLLQLPGNRLLVVDHKKSSTSKRKARMSAGWDLQAALYRHMLRTAVDPKPDLLTALAPKPDIGVAYHLMNDGGILVHGFDLELADYDVLTNDVAAEAEAHLEERIALARAGTITLNRAGDAKFFKETANLSPYALENNPLVSAFTLPDSPEQAGADEENGQ